jgi:glycosyltransferase involved in cell wall biosynthesis
MIVKNETEYLGNCLKSVEGLFDEVIIVDTGSTDNTKDIALSFGCKVFDFKWINDFAAARNFSFSKATKDYVMWLDADDIIDSVNRERFLALKNTLTPEIDVVYMKYNVSFNKNGDVSLTSVRERIVKRERNFIWNSPIHEALVVYDCNSLYSDIEITHTGEFSAKDSIERNAVYLKEAISKPDCPVNLFYNYSEFLRMNNEFDEAIRMLHLFIEKGGKHSGLFMLACMALHHCYVNKNEYEKALDSLLMYMDSNKPRSEIFCTLGEFMLEKCKDVDIAIHWLNEAIKCPLPNAKEGNYLLPECYYYLPYFLIGKCFIQKREYKRALDAYENCLKYSPNDEEALLLKDKLSKLLSQLT